MKTKHQPPQFELPGTTDVFNLAAETGEDGQRLRRELEAAESDKLLAKTIAEQQQPELL
jgi:hypothetical protein